MSPVIRNTTNIVEVPGRADCRLPRCARGVHEFITTSICYAASMTFSICHPGFQCFTDPLRHAPGCPGPQ
eukprot:304676-Rhodomonas_salina.1